MSTLRGIPAAGGSRTGPAWVRATEAIVIPDRLDGTPELETVCLREALFGVAAELEEMASAAEGELSEVLQAQASMARDPELYGIAAEAVMSGEHGARAIRDAGEHYARLLEASGSDYLAARGEDVRDVCRRVTRRLAGLEDAPPAGPREPSVVIAPELAPADVAGMAPAVITAIATEQGSATSHTAIVARALGVPAVVGVAGLIDAVSPGDVVGVDGDEGDVYVAPDAEVVARLEAKEKDRLTRLEGLRRLAGLPCATADGYRGEVAANVGGVAELRAALENGSEGVGLLRTEFLYLGRSTPPTEDEQAAELSELVTLLAGRRLIVRTFDFGADKPVPFLDVSPEPNPALGVRGLRLARRHPDLMQAQLRAVAQAAGRDGARVGVMAPMVASVEDAEWFLAQAEAAGLRARGVELGAMVELPSVVLVAEELAELFDFLSVGTNDLTQYLCGADRLHADLAYLQDPFAPSVLRAVALVCEGAAGRAWVGVCGEAAGDPSWALVAIGLGVTELSVSPHRLLEVGAPSGSGPSRSAATSRPRSWPRGTRSRPGGWRGDPPECCAGQYVLIILALPIRTRSTGADVS